MSHTNKKTDLDVILEIFGFLFKSVKLGLSKSIDTIEIFIGLRASAFFLAIFITAYYPWPEYFYKPPFFFEFLIVEWSCYCYWTYYYRFF